MGQINDEDYIRKIFSEYYQNCSFPIVSIEKREFGIGNNKKIDSRHLSFKTINEFRNFLKINTPLFVSHSISYYEFPSATPMERKIQKGADLVFDLDIHAEGKFGAYHKLPQVKEDLIRLVKDFIIGDFGINGSDLLIVFSGNRGYHVHVRNEKFQSLGSEERRELVDYVMGNGLNYKDFFTLSDTKPPKLLGPMPNEGGYRGRFAREAIKTVRETPNLISRTLKGEKGEFFISGINEGNWSRISLDLNDLVSRLSKVSGNLTIGSVDTDAGVTQDLSKLIRVPNSIHGDTGLIAIEVKDIEKFEPFKDAQLNTKREIKIEFIEDVPNNPQIIGAQGPFKKGETVGINEGLGIFFIIKGCAKRI